MKTEDRPGAAARRHRRALVAAACALAGALPSCASPPKELAQLRVENEVLREELRIVRQNCSYYRDLDIQLDKESTPGAP